MQMLGGGVALTGTKGASTHGVLSIDASNNETWYHPHLLLETARQTSSGHARDFLKRLAKKYKFDTVGTPYADARLLSITVGRKAYLCVNDEGLRALFEVLFEPGAKQAALDAATLKRAARAVLKLHLGDETEEEEEGAEEGDGDEGDSEEEEEDAAERVDYRRAKPKGLDSGELQESSRHELWLLEKLLSRLTEACRLTDDVPLQLKADSKRRYLTTAEFWAIAGEVAPPREFKSATKGGRRRHLVDVPMDHSLLLQLYRARTGMLRAADLPEAMRLGRADVEFKLSQLSQKYAGASTDFALYLIAHGGSRAVIDTLHQGAGASLSYSSSVRKLRYEALREVTAFWEHQLELPLKEIWIFYLDNYFARRRCAR